MIGRRSTIGLALLCAFAFCAFAAQSAMAQVGTKAVNTTAVTCVKVAKAGTGPFEDKHCDSLHATQKGEYEHQSVAVGKTKELDAVNTSSIWLKATLAGVATELECSTMTTDTKKSFVQNVESAGKHAMAGTGTANFTNCSVKKPAKCRVQEPIVAIATFEGVEGLGAGKNEMGVEFVGIGANKEFAELFFSDNGGACSIANGGKPFIVGGSAIGTSPSSPQTNQYTGATIVFEPGNGMQTIEVGLKKVEVSMTVAPFGAGGGAPIPLTTVT